MPSRRRCGVFRVDDPPEDAAGRRNLVNQLIPFVALLDDLGLRDEADRFRALLPTDQNGQDR